MIIDTPTLADLTGRSAEIVVIGAGPLGLCTGLALADRGRSVLVLESGRAGTDSRLQDLAADHVLTPDTHHDPRITVARRLGGTSNLWGGRCLPSDPIDFQARPWLGLDAWPVTETALAPYLAPACAALGAGEAVFRAPVPGLEPADDSFSIDTLERWSNQPRTHLLHKDRIAQTAGFTVALGVTVTGFHYDAEGRIVALDLWFANADPAAAKAVLPVSTVILAAGGNASARLLLNEQAKSPDLFGGPDGVLGRHYMSHVNGQIADIVFENDPLHAAMDFHVDAHGSYVRRRFAPSAAVQEANRLSNVTFWPVVPEVSQPAHRSGPLSAVFMALTTPGIGKRVIAEPIRLKHIGPPPHSWWPHLRNVVMDPLRTIGFVPWFLWNRRYAKNRIPGFFLHNAARRYGLEFHSEHLPAPDSRLTLGTDIDASGLRRLEIDFRFSDADVASVLRAHDAFETWLTSEGYGHLVYRVPLEGRAEGVLAEAKHGNHQEGTLRMGDSPTSGVVDANCTAFGVPNLHVVSTGVLPSSSQANPTLTALQLGLRLVDHLAPASPAT